MAGYSATPLVRKLGIREGTEVMAIHPPADYARLLGPLPDRARIVTRARGEIAFVHLFASSAAGLQRDLTRLRGTIRSDGRVSSW